TWLCRSVLSVKMYAALASINWMFNEGLLLHTRTAVCVFQQDAPFKLYYFVGWGELSKFLVIIKFCRRAIKATILLFPLLGITHLLFCVNPQDDATLEEAYMITNAVLQSLQGIFLAVLYCFMNTEVQSALRNAYLRAAVRRSATTRTRDRGYSNTSATYYDCSATSSPRFKGTSAKGVHIHLSDLPSSNVLGKQSCRV
ncbi:PDF receptor-like, partial [Limulus polyphemus]|uniref:PDF receptor-like n=1 Tax=Limulus polyphemus TaxID=6850 RepID=A0ABM1RW90_LIMPO